MTSLRSSFRFLVPTRTSLRAGVFYNALLKGRILLLQRVRQTRRFTQQLTLTMAAAPPPSSSSWDDLYQRLVVYHQHHGHCFAEDDTNDPELSNFCQEQRKQRKGLSSTQIDQLSALGYVWNGNQARADKAWFVKFKMLLDYKQQYGDCKVPFSHKELFKWVSHQRAAHSSRTIRPDRYEKLQQIGFCWVSKAPQQWKETRDTQNYDQKWHSMYEKLVQHYKRYGDSDVRSSYIDGKIDPLYSWVRQQRIAYQKNTLRQDRQHLLEQLKFVWKARERKWPLPLAGNSKQSSLTAAGGGVTVPLPPQGGHLYIIHKRPASLSDQTSAAAASAAPEPAPKRRKVRFRDWSDMYNELVLYRQQHGHCDVPARDPNHPELANWVQYNRKSYHGKASTTLTQERKQLLEDLDFSWDNSTVTPQDRWNAKYQRLVEYKQQYGNCRVPSKEAEYKDLFKWTSHQRTRYKHGLLERDRIDKLDALNFEWVARSDRQWTAERNTEFLDNKWNEMYRQLVQYHKRHSHCNVRQTYIDGVKADPLYSWVRQQRIQYSQGILPRERKDKLEQLGFLWRLKSKPGNVLGWASAGTSASRAASSNESSEKENEHDQGDENDDDDGAYNEEKETDEATMQEYADTFHSNLDELPDARELGLHDLL